MKKFWNIYKYDFAGLFLYVIFWCILFIRYDMETYHWQYWVTILVTVLFRLLGYKEGRKIERRHNAENLVNWPNDICVTVPAQKVYKLKDIETGIFFSVIKNDNEIKEPLDKYVKINNVYDTYKCGTYNMTLRKGEILDGDSNVIVYKCKSIYTPKNLKIVKD